MSKTKKWALYGALIGLVIGILETVGTLMCNWNPFDTSNVPTGFCFNQSGLYLPFLPVDFIGYMIHDAIGLPNNTIVNALLPIIIFTIVISILSLIIGIILNKWSKK